MTLLTDYLVSIQRACCVVMFHRSGWYHRTKGKEKDLMLRARMRQIAQTRVRCGMWRVYTLLRREGWPDNHKRVHRLYRLEGLNLRNLRPRRCRTAAPIRTQDGYNIGAGAIADKSQDFFQRKKGKYWRAWRTWWGRSWKKGFY